MARKNAGSMIRKTKGAKVPRSELVPTKVVPETVTGVVEVKKKRRYRPGTKALREIRKFQQGGELLIPRAPFQRVVRDITASIKTDLRMQSTAIAALQEAAEAFLVNLFEDTQTITIHAGRQEIRPGDMHLAMRMTCPAVMDRLISQKIRGSRE